MLGWGVTIRGGECLTFTQGVVTVSDLFYTQGVVNVEATML